MAFCKDAPVISCKQRHGTQQLNLVVRGGVVSEAIVSFDRDLAGFHVQDHVAEASTVVLISVRDKRLEVLLQVREVGFRDFTFFVSVVLGGIALDVFVHPFIA